MPIGIVGCVHVGSLLTSGILAALVELEFPLQFASLLVNLLLPGLRVNVGYSQVGVLVSTNPCAQLISLNQLAAHGCCHRRIEFAVNHLHSPVNLDGLAAVQLIKYILVGLLVILDVGVRSLCILQCALSNLLIRHHLDTCLLGNLGGDMIQGFVYSLLGFGLLWLSVPIPISFSTWSRRFSFSSSVIC